MRLQPVTLPSNLTFLLCEMGTGRINSQSHCIICGKVCCSSVIVSFLSSFSSSSSAAESSSAPRDPRRLLPLLLSLSASAPPRRGTPAALGSSYILHHSQPRAERRVRGPGGHSPPRRPRWVSDPPPGPGQDHQPGAATDRQGKSSITKLDACWVSTLPHPRQVT